jgi:ribosomal protein S18 acetylase RimI-like enzyme
VVRESNIVLSVCRVEQTHEDPKEWMLYGLAVHSDCRRRGIGRTLVQTSIRFARSRGASSIRSDTHVDSRTSIAVHRALGFLDKGGFIAVDGDERVTFSTAIAGPQGT